MDCRRAALRDDVADTLNYKTVAKRVIAFVAESQFHLVETLVEQNRPAAPRGVRP